MSIDKTRFIHLNQFRFEPLYGVRDNVRPGVDTDKCFIAFRE